MTPCRWCGTPRGHDGDPVAIAECKAGKARMARARQAAGSPLNDVDREALA